MKHLKQPFPQSIFFQLPTPFYVVFCNTYRLPTPFPVKMYQVLQSLAEKIQSTSKVRFGCQNYKDEAVDRSTSYA